MTGYYKFMDIVFKINYVYPSFTEFAQDYTTNDTNFECEITTTKEKIVEWEKTVQSGVSAAEITDKQIKEYFGE